MSQKEAAKAQPRRKFLSGLLAGVGGAAALLSSAKRARAATKAATTTPVKGPILYRRTQEAERYYKTLYQ